MFGISFLELLVIFVIAFLLLGPEKLQDFAKSLGKFISGINNFSSNIKDEITVTLNPQVDNNKNETNDFKKDKLIENIENETNNDKNKKR
ncbi:MAG: twin-arginine translocase TatA/TatE family subunit [Bdellovibrionota bacterium]|nr:twin-arginine translocase TatA/TatE family subunit [Pseudomonadota bacterium]MDY6089690.1 twin-arginine translocase TatA/TatE family subunit [Bdellovibrionota bacterium]